MSLRLIRHLLILLVATFAVLAQPVGSFAAEQGAAVHNENLVGLPLASVAPFVLLLGCIAVMPLAAEHWWEKNFNKLIVVLVLTLPLLGYLLSQYGSTAVLKIEHAVAEYIGFILLLGSLFVISGGIYIQGSLSGTPIVNTAMLAIGAVLANFIGTTGASMVLIRPLIRANKKRKNISHIVVFFIFVVSNCGGLLTPLGDPPLFLGYQKGVPFEWTMQLWKEWAFVNIALLVIFNIFDQVIFNREEAEGPESLLDEVMHHEPMRIKGLFNVVFLGGIVLTIYAKGEGWLGERFGIQEGLMLFLAICSYFTTSKSIHVKNNFKFGPILEVAILFIGIFMAMIPAIAILNAEGPRMGLDQPWQFFWASGSLSSFLDNAPTYIAFASAAAGIHGVTNIDGRYLAELLAKGPDAVNLLIAISCGSVFMGANTYIGNGPNFMVKAIAEHDGVKMPSFFGYMAYSICILIPIFIAVTFIFFR